MAEGQCRILYHNFTSTAALISYDQNLFILELTRKMSQYLLQCTQQSAADCDLLRDMKPPYTLLWLLLLLLFTNDCYMWSFYCCSLTSFICECVILNFSLSGTNEPVSYKFIFIQFSSSGTKVLQQQCLRQVRLTAEPCVAPSCNKEYSTDLQENIRVFNWMYTHTHTHTCIFLICALCSSSTFNAFHTSIQLLVQLKQQSSCEDSTSKKN